MTHVQGETISVTVVVPMFNEEARLPHTVRMWDDCGLLRTLSDRVLGDTQRTALWLRYAEDLSIGQIAAVLGKTPIAVRVALCRARRTLAAYDEGSAQTSRRSQTAAGGLRSPVKPRSTNTSLEMRYVELDSP